MHVTWPYKTLTARCQLVPAYSNPVSINVEEEQRFTGQDVVLQ
jgi:hypothetical protein